MSLKKYATIFAISSLVLGNALTASAQTTSTATSSLETLIQTLQNQITTLKSQLDTLNQAQTQVKTTTSGITDTLKLISQLREGASGEDVKLLQEILAADSNVYPEGLVTGYFGKLTAKAVKRFQEKNGLEQAGQVGPKTLAKLNEALEKNPLVKDASDNKTHCAIVPPGHLIAPGWLGKQNGVKPVVPVCQTIPHGIAIKLGLSTSTATSTPDTTPPTLSGVSATNITSSSVQITWSTNEAATSKVSYSTSTPVDTVNAPTVNDSTLVLSHGLAIPNLAASTTYYYVVSSRDAAGNTATSSGFSFVTAGQ
jgi:peptidoglycan hydrolase-like protein with peptidoglycan-binding domain